MPISRKKNDSNISVLVTALIFLVYDGNKKILIYDDKKLEDFVNFVDLMHTWNFKLLFNKKKTYATEQTGKLKISMRIYRSLQIVILMIPAVFFDETRAKVETNFA